MYAVLGLMREARAELDELESPPGCGTNLRARVPLT